MTQCSVMLFGILGGVSVSDSEGLWNKAVSNETDRNNSNYIKDIS